MTAFCLILLRYGAAARIGLLVKMLIIINTYLADIITKELKAYPPY